MDSVKEKGPGGAVEQETLLARKVMADAHFRITEVTLVILTGLAVFYTLYFAAGIILPFVFALIFGLLLNPAVGFLHRRIYLPRMAGSLLAVMLVFSVVGGIFYAVSVPASAWIAKAPQTLPVLKEKLGFMRKPVSMVEGIDDQLHTLMHSAHGQKNASGRNGGGQDAGGGNGGGQGAGRGQGEAQGGGQVQPQTVTVSQGGGMGGMGMTVLEGTRAFLGQLLTFTVVLFFLLAEGDTLLRRFVEILPGFTEKKRAVQIASEVESNISIYLVTITVMNLLVGVLNGLSIWAFGLPDPLLWGTAAFLLNYVPILGPLTGIAMFFIVGLFTFSHPLWALAPAGVYFLIHVLEGETVTPMLLARRFTLNPLLVIASLMFWDWLWGVPGALLAVPLLAVVKIVCDHIEALTPLGHLLGAEAGRRSAQAAK